MCRSWTHARRHPLLVGKIQGWRLPFMLSLTQLGVGVGGLVLMLWTRPAWGAAVHSGGEQLILTIGVPLVAAWAVRHVRVEGRSPVAMFVGLVAYGNRRMVGAELAGRPVRARTSRRSRPRGRVWVSPSPVEPAAPAASPAVPVRAEAASPAEAICQVLDARARGAA